MALTCPLSFPIAYALDICLGEEIGNVYNREQLVEYIRVTRDHNRLEDNEVGIISGALALRTKVAGDVMTPLDQVYMLPIETKLDYTTVSQINARGFSRVPVYAVSFVIGICFFFTLQYPLPLPHISRDPSFIDLLIQGL
jgi:metal transporter CNNM